MIGGHCRLLFLGLLLGTPICTWISLQRRPSCLFLRNPELHRAAFVLNKAPQSLMAALYDTSVLGPGSLMPPSRVSLDEKPSGCPVGLQCEMG